jgi:LemA protein
MDPILTAILLIILLSITAILVLIIIVYNGLVRLKNNIDKSWANIDVLLKQRSSEIPNLVSTVKGYMVHERETLETLTKARSFLGGAQTLSSKAAAHDVISDSLKTIFAVAENYPNLKAVENFLKLQNRITGLENEIADRREFYNDSVMLYDTRILSFPDLIVARMMGATKVELFEASEEDKKLVKVNI